MSRLPYDPAPAVESANREFAPRSWSVFTCCANEALAKRSMLPTDANIVLRMFIISLHFPNRDRGARRR
jgi:hypothetical protein